MKNILLKKAVAAVLAATTVLSVAPTGVSAAWNKDNYGNWNWIEGNSRAIGWKSIDGKWYYFDYSGNMRKGWINDWGAWYYTDSTGVMQTGIIEIDGKVYAFGGNGIMQTGNISINGRSYTFNQQGIAVGDKIPTPNKSFDINNNILDGKFKPPYTENGESWGANSNNSSYKEDEEDDIFDDVKEVKVKFKVTFDSNGGSKVSSISGIKAGKTIELPDEPTKDGYEFDGWYKDEDFDKEFTDDTKVRSNLKLHAKWVKKGSSGGSESGSGNENNGSDNEQVQLVKVTSKVFTNDSGVSSVKVTANAKNFASGTKATIELIDKITGQVVEGKTQTVGINSNGYIGCTFTDMIPGTFTAKVTVGKVSVSSEEFKVLSKNDISNTDIQNAADNLKLGDVSLVTSDLNLPTTGAYGTTIKWTANNLDGETDKVITIEEDSSSNNNVIGKVTRPDGDGSNVKVKLTATISKGDATPLTKDFIAYVKRFNTKLGKAVEGINNAVNMQGDEDAKILAVKEKLTQDNMLSIGVSEAQYNKYKDLELTSDKEQVYQLGVAKAVYADIKSRNYISGNSNENVYKKELESEAIGISNIFNMAVINQSRSKQENDNKTESDKKLKEAKEKLTKAINDQYSDGVSRTTLKAKQEENTKESWNRYILALTNAKEVESNDNAVLSNVEGAINYLNSSKDALTGAHLVTVNIYKNDDVWTDFYKDMSFQKGLSTPIKADRGGESSYKATLTKGEYKILVDGKPTGKTITVPDTISDNKLPEENLYYYTVKYEMKNSDITKGEIIAKYGNTLTGYLSVKSGDAVLYDSNNDLVLTMNANSNETKEFTYLWSSIDGKKESESASYSISDLKVHGKVDLVCNVYPNEVIISNIKGMAANDNSGNATVTAKVYKYESQNAKVELFKDGALIAAKNGSDVKIDEDGNLTTDFIGLGKGAYKVKITIGALERESSGYFYVNKIAQEVLDGVNAINDAMKKDAGDTKYSNLVNLFNTDGFSKSAQALGLNKSDYANLIELTNKYTTEVAKSVYRPLEYTVDEVGIISKNFNNAVMTQTRLKKNDDANLEATEKLKKAREELKVTLDNEMDVNRTTWKKKETDYTEESWRKYVPAVMNAVKVEQNQNSSLSQIESATKTLIASVLKNGYEATITINKDGSAWDGTGTITLKKKLDNGSLGTSIPVMNDSLGKVKTKRLESGIYNIFINNKDIGEQIEIKDAANSSTVLNYYTFNCNLTGTSSIDITRSKVSLTEVNNRSNSTNTIKSGDAVLGGNNVIITVTPSMISGISGMNEFSYDWTGVTSDTNIATAYKVSSKLDIGCKIKPKNAVIINILASSDDTGKVIVTGKVDCVVGKVATVELLKSNSSLNPQIIKNDVVIQSDGTFNVDFNAATSGTYSAKITVDSITKSSNNIEVTKK
ncbi:InlB B-repeat-containing protein [Clostridium weizhouense]|uniref:InlB B-repeat-containing protein n=1 Tax=Clostridium weizhouense TaxID=2859781 RepID=A0ABS7AQ25_9CLOT|nr:InlB B-repeat-containing protein [Clostridium weizhouense]MBW6410763.1 InlB B-repeat-containing protein [Clostridium weizhouense]